MASRIMHYVIAKHIPNMDCFERFKLGVMLPNAYCGTRGTYDSHLKTEVCDGAKKTYNLNMFRELYEKQLRNDDLYRGYYSHLIQDLYFRDFVYNKYHWNSRIPGNVERLHNDYKLLNLYIIKQYRLDNALIIPNDFNGEPITSLYSFDLRTSQADFQNDFTEIPSGEYFFFTPKMAEEYIENAVNATVFELQRIDNGGCCMDMYEMAWNK